MQLKRQWRDMRHRLWLKLAILGNEDAFKRMYRDLYPPVAAFLSVRIRSHEDVEDVISVVFIRFLENLESYRPAQGPVITWILTMANNAAIDHQRRLAVQARSLVTSPATGGRSGMIELEQTIPGADVLNRLILQEDVTRVRDILGRQPQLVREIYALRYGQGLRIKDIARALDMGEAAVKKRLSRTNHRIREELQAEQPRIPTGQGGPQCAAAD